MSPGSVVIVSSPPETSYAAGFSRTIAFQRSLSRLVPSNWSSRAGPDGPPLPVVSENESNAATGAAVVAVLPNANTPIRAFAGNGAARPTDVQLVPSVEYSPVRFVPSDLIRTQKSSGKSAGMFGVESAPSLRGLAAFS